MERTKAIVTVIVVAAAAVGMLTGCGSFTPCVTGRAQENPVCSSGGKVTLIAPDLATSNPPRIVLGQSCLAENGQCTNTPSFAISTYGDYSHPAADDLFLDVQVLGGGHNSLPSPAVSLSGELGNTANLQVISGDFDVRASDQSSLVASFSIELATATGTRLTVTGEADVTDCHLEEMCSF